MIILINRTISHKMWLVLLEGSGKTEVIKSLVQMENRETGSYHLVHQ